MTKKNLKKKNWGGRIAKKRDKSSKVAKIKKWLKARKNKK
jgi:hypothetical protein